MECDVLTSELLRVTLNRKVHVLVEAHGLIEAHSGVMLWSQPGQCDTAMRDDGMVRISPSVHVFGVTSRRGLRQFQKAASAILNASCAHVLFEQKTGLLLADHLLVFREMFLHCIRMSLMSFTIVNWHALAVHVVLLTYISACWTTLTQLLQRMCKSSILHQITCSRLHNARCQHSLQ